jgi:dihydrofolate reductase
MTRTQYYTASSLDGFIADPNNSLDWLLQFTESGGDYENFIKDVGALCMGSTTYEWVLDHEKLLDPAAHKKWPYQQPCWVFSSRTLPAIAGADVRFVRGDVRPVHDEMVRAANGKNVWIVGGGELVGQFHDHGLLDDVVITFASVTLGAGAPLLPRKITTPPMRLISAKQYGSSFATLHYEVQRP